jgi:transposase InsO family protein
VAIDDCSRVAFVQNLPDEKGPACAAFLESAALFFASNGVAIEEVMTDNARNYTTSRVFQDALRTRSIKHLKTPRYHPQSNGKAERFNRTLLEEFACAQLFTSNDERTAALGPWVASYNADRNHTAIGGLTPLQRLRQQR